MTLIKIGRDHYMKSEDSYVEVENNKIYKFTRDEALKKGWACDVKDYDNIYDWKLPSFELSRIMQKNYKGNEEFKDEYYLSNHQYKLSTDGGIIEYVCNGNNFYSGTGFSSGGQEAARVRLIRKMTDMEIEQEDQIDSFRHIEILKKGYSDWEFWRFSNEDIKPNLSGVELENSNNLFYSGINFSKSNLTNANLEGCDLSHANLEDCNLTNANLRGCNLTNANLKKAIVKDAIFDSANLKGANIDGVDYRSAYGFSP